MVNPLFSSDIKQISLKILSFLTDLKIIQKNLENLEIKFNLKSIVLVTSYSELNNLDDEVDQSFSRRISSLHSTSLHIKLLYQYIKDLITQIRIYSDQINTLLNITLPLNIL